MISTVLTVYLFSEYIPMFYKPDWSGLAISQKTESGTEEVDVSSPLVFKCVAILTILLI